MMMLIVEWTECLCYVFLLVIITLFKLKLGFCFIIFLCMVKLRNVQLMSKYLFVGCHADLGTANRFFDNSCSF